MEELNLTANESRKKLIEYWSEENELLKVNGYFHYTSQRMFSHYLPDIKKMAVLDVGCGLGMMMEHFAGQGNRVSGIDISPRVLKELDRNKLTVQEADARNIPFRDNCFDLVYSLGVIEHFIETQQALEEQVRVCKPGGWVVAVVPYLNTPYFWGSLVLSRLMRPRHDFQTTYGRPFTRRGFRLMFEKAGCEHISVKPYYGSVFLRVLGFKFYQKLVDFFENSFLSNQFGLVIWGIGQKK